MNEDLQADCVFCQKIDRHDADVTFEQRRPVASFEPLNPVTPGHRLFVPTWHGEHRDMVALSTCVRSAYDHAARQFGSDFNLITSSGPAATQTVPHLHVHYVPRRPGDGLHLPWTGQQR